MFLCTYIFQVACGKDGNSDERAGLKRSTYPNTFSKHQKYNILSYETLAKKFKTGRSWHKTIAVIFSACLVEVRRDHMRYSRNFGHDVTEFRHAKTAAYNAFFQLCSQSHPITNLSPTVCSPHHRVGVQNSKDT